MASVGTPLRPDLPQLWICESPRLFLLRSVWNRPGLADARLRTSTSCAAFPGSTPLHPVPTLPRRFSPPTSALEGERKQVTVLFADLKGSMELLADRDPEEARQLLGPGVGADDRRSPSIRSGFVNQVMGDGIVASLGAADHA